MGSPYFRLYPTDFEAKTSHLTLAEDGAYNRLLRLCWMTPGCSLPDDDEWIMRRVRAHTDEDKAVVRSILAEFFQRKNQRVFNKRLTEENEHVSSRIKTASENGSKGGRPRKPLKSKETEESNGFPEEKPKKANQNQNQNQNHKEIEAKTPLDLLSEVASEQVARDFIDHRKGMKKPMTVQAAKAMANRLRDHGNPDAVLLLSIENGWQGVFPEKINAPVSIRPREGPWGGATIASLPPIQPPPKKASSA